MTIIMWLLICAIKNKQITAVTKWKTIKTVNMHFRGSCSQINVMFSADRVIIFLTTACKQCLRVPKKDAVWGKLRNSPLAQSYSINLLACACWLKYLASEQNLTSQSRDVEWEREGEGADRHDTSLRVRTWANDVANRLNFDSPTGLKNCSLWMLTAIWKS